MRTNLLPKGRGLSDAAERQMRTWVLDLETRQRLEQETPEPKQLIYPYVAISRETGIGASAAFATVIVERLFDLESRRGKRRAALLALNFGFVVFIAGPLRTKRFDREELDLRSYVWIAPYFVGLAVLLELARARGGDRVDLLVGLACQRDRVGSTPLLEPNRGQAAQENGGKDGIDGPPPPIG